MPGGSSEGRRRPSRDRPDPRSGRVWGSDMVYLSARGERRRVPALPQRRKAEMTAPFDDLTRLAVPVRHEANNLFAALAGTIDILLRTASTDRDRARAERMRDATTRLEALLKAYVALAAPPATAEGTDAVQLLALLRPLILLTLGPGREVEVAASPGLPRVASSSPEMRAEILSLVRDAAASLPAGGALHLTLVTVPGGVALAAVPAPGAEARPPLILPLAEG